MHTALEMDEQGIPYAASVAEWNDPDVEVTVDGKVPSGCIAFDRRRGYVECREVEESEWWRVPGRGFATVKPDGGLVRRYGKVEVRRLG
jgi:hypothetical protein